MALGSLARAEEPSIPVRLQAGLMAKIAAYDRNMSARAGDSLQIGILTKTDDADSVRVANEMMRALADIGEIAGLPHEDSIVAYTSAATLHEKCAAQHLAVVYVTPGFEPDVPAIAQALWGVDVLTVSAVAAYVPKGIVVGFEALGGQPHMLVHLRQARAQHVDFQANLLKLMKVYE